MVPAPTISQDPGMTDQRTQLPGTPLRRATSDAVWAGVASGIGARLEIAPWIVRLAFIVTTLFGGLGLLLYVAGWVLIPAEGESDPLVERWLHDGDKTNWAGVILIGVGAVILLGSVRFLDGEVVFAVGLMVAGVLLYRGTFDDRDPGETAGQVLAETPDVEDGRTSGEDPEEVEQSAEDGDPTGAPAVDGQAKDLDTGEAVDQYDLGQSILAGGAGRPAKPGKWPGEQARPRPPAPHKSILGRVTIAAMMIVLGVLAIIDNWWNSITASQYLAAVVLVVGIGLLVGAWWGRARATILIGILAVMAMQTAGVFRVPLSGGFGDPVFAPHSIEELRPEYRLTAGQLTLDFRALRIEGEAEVAASVAAGELVVWVPNDVDLIVTADAVVGEVVVLGSTDSGPDASVARTIRAEDGDGTLVLDLDVGFGQVNVRQLEALGEVGSTEHVMAGGN